MKSIRIVYITEPRTTIALRVKDAYTVEIKKPPTVNEKRVADFMEEKKDWIATQLAEQREKAHDIADLGISTYQRVMVYGELFPIRYGSKKSIFDGTKMLLTGKNNPQVEIKKTLQLLAKRELGEGLAHTSVSMGLRYNRLVLKDNRSNWGSCSTKRNINLNWRLVMAPPEVSRYVIVHELAHLKHMDHSRNFWKLVERYDPEYQIHQHWLKENGYLLHVY